MLFLTFPYTLGGKYQVVNAYIDIRRRRMRKIAFWIFLVLNAMFSACAVSPDQFPTPSIQHSVKSDGDIEHLWSLQNIYIAGTGFSPMLDAASGKVCFLGDINNTEGNKIICLNSLTGEVVWQKESGAHTAFDMTMDSLYVAYSGFTRIRKYDLSGNILWSRDLRGTGAIYLQANSDEVQVLVIPEYYYVLNAFTGEEVRTKKKEHILYIDKTQLFVDALNLESRSVDTNELIWEANLYDVLELAPTFLEDIILLRTGRVIGTVYAIDKKTGKTLWETGDDIVSTIAYSPYKNRIYLLTAAGKLIGVDKTDGNMVVLAEFFPSQLTLNGKAGVGFCNMAFDEENKILFVSLGDSAQLIAIQEP